MNFHSRDLERVALFAATAIAATTLFTFAAAATPAQTFKVETLASGLEKPWGIEVLPDDRLIITEQPGRLRIIEVDGTVGDEIAGTPTVDARGQGGLLDIALDPKFSENRLLYLTFAEPGRNQTNGTTAIRARLSNDDRQLENVEVIFRQQPKVASTKHYGSRLVFDHDGFMFITTGERSDRPFRGQSQELGSLLGKVIRLKSDGTIPEDNPFPNASNARPEIWSYGHRNIQGAAIHPTSGQLWTIEHGPRGGDELNIPQAGKNYGWPVVSHGVNYDGSDVGIGKETAAGMVDPIHTWTPVIAPGGMAFYGNEQFPAWNGSLFIAGMRSKALVRLTLDGPNVISEERLLEGSHRFNDVTLGAGGVVYAVTDSEDGKVLKLIPVKPAG